MLLENFQLDGVVPVSRQDLELFRETISTTIISVIRSHLNTAQQGHDSNLREGSSATGEREHLF